MTRETDEPKTMARAEFLAEQWFPKPYRTLVWIECASPRTRHVAVRHKNLPDGAVEGVGATFQEALREALKAVREAKLARDSDSTGTKS